MEYIGKIRQGSLIPYSEPKTVKESNTTAQVDGCWSFGQVAANYSTELVIKKAKESGVGCVAIRNLNHLGRLGFYAEKMAKSGLASLIFSASGGHGICQAPFGGLERRLSTNPMALGFPSHSDSPFLADIATSVVSEGKLRVYRARGEKVPEGWIIDAEGHPSTDPNDFYAGGALLPLGGSEGHKGYALAFMMDLFAGILSRGGFPGKSAQHYSNNSTFIAIDAEQFLPLEELKHDAGLIVQHLKKTKPANSSQGIMYPGEKEATARRENKDKRIEIDESTWDQIVSILRDYSLDEIADELG